MSQYRSPGECEVCHCSIIKTAPQQRYCKLCAVLVKRRTRQAYKPRKKKQTITKQKLTMEQAMLEARKAHLTYGKYIAKIEGGVRFE